MTDSAIPAAACPDATDVMVDLETMGTKPYAPILSIGACAFRMDAPDEEPMLDVFYQVVDLESCLELGLRPSAGTITWWIDQTERAREVLHDPSRVKLPLALDAFTDWLQSRPVTLWGNSARFDMGLLEACYSVCHKELPWPFWKEGCYRTIKNLPGAKAVPVERQGTYHNALDDAVTQAVHLRRIMRHLNLVPATATN